MEIDKVFSNDVDGVADNLFSAVKNSVSEIKAMQQRKAAENVQLVIQALKKIESDLQDKFDGVTTVIEKRVSSIKDGRDGLDGRNGRDGKDGRPGRDGAPGARGAMGVPGTNGRDGEDGVSVTDAKIDFDGSLIISLSSGREINVGEVVAPDLAEKIKVITNGGGTSQSVLDSLASLQAQITALSNLGAVNYVGTWNASTNSPTITSGSGEKGDYYVVSVAGSTNIDGQTLWGVGDWIIFNGVVWQKVDGGSTGDFTTLSASGTVTFSGGTANGVAYLNGSKVLTTGSALTFDGTNLGLGQAAVAVGSSPVLEIYSGANNGILKFTNSTTGATNSDGTWIYQPAGSNNFIVQNQESSGDLRLFSTAHIWGDHNYSTEYMRLTSTGLGIGTSSPGTKLDVRTSAQQIANLASSNASGGYITLGRTGATALLGSYNATSGGGSTINADALFLRNANGIGFGSGGAAVTMILDSSGNLGIGTATTTNGKLSVQAGTSTTGNSAFFTTADGLWNTYLQIQHSTAGIKLFNGNSNSATGNNLIFGNAGTAETMRIDGSGNLLVGTTSAGTLAASGRGLIEVNGSSDSAFAMEANGTMYGYLYNSPSEFRVANATANPVTFFTDNTERARITSGGEVYIAGTTDQGAYNLQVNGTGVWGAGAYVNGSDRNLKDNIQSLDSCLDVVMAMRPVTFQYKPEHSKDQSVQPGFIAQELQEAMAGKAYIDGVVQAGPEYLNVAYQNIIPILVKAIQELKAEVAALKGNQP